MATQQSTQSAPAETLNRKQSRVVDAASVHAYVLSVMAEWQGEISKIYSVASAASTYCDREDTPNERNLFLVIEDISCNTLLPKLLIEKINELAKLAGVEVQS